MSKKRVTFDIEALTRAGCAAASLHRDALRHGATSIFDVAAPKAPPHARYPEGVGRLRAFMRGEDELTDAEVADITRRMMADQRAKVAG